MVLDRMGKALTDNRHNYRLLLYTENKPDVTKAVENISQILALSENEKNIILNRIKNARTKSIISLIDNLPWDDLARIEANHHKLNGISIESGILRQYEFPFQTAHFLGYVSLPSEKEVDKRNQKLFLHPDFRIGKSGIEKSFDQTLRGKFGVKYVEVNAFGIPVRTLSTKKSIEGRKIDLTIDIRMQDFALEQLKDKVASAVVIDVKTGEIISLASSPSFNPNKFVEGISVDYWDQLILDPQKPLNNKPISAAYPPGSTFKLMVTIAALESGINPFNKVYCNGSYRLGRRKFHCWKEEGHGHLNMSDAIKHSCNVYFFSIANQVGIEKINEVATRFGYGNRFDISLSGVKSGNVPSDQWKRKLFNKPWVGGDTLNTAIGQGFVLATPLQMAVVTARLANGGVPILPHLVKSQKINNQYQELLSKPLANKKHIDFVLEGMNKVINEDGGTAYHRRIKEKGFQMAGKTGTSQVISKRESQMTNEEVSNNQNHAIFVGFAPVNNPKYAASVVIEHGGSGSQAAAPIGKEILLKAQQLLVES
jgi:penicillin-binding protein 2